MIKTKKKKDPFISDMEYKELRQIFNNSIFEEAVDEHLELPNEDPRACTRCGGDLEMGDHSICSLW